MAGVCSRGRASEAASDWGHSLTPPEGGRNVGLSAVRLLGIAGSILQVEGLDILDHTPLLDLKPYVPAFDAFEAERIGWCAEVQGCGTLADGRFEAGSAR
jgi:tRNA (adenine37-N6)-methyltransferase